MPVPMARKTKSSAAWAMPARLSAECGEVDVVVDGGGNAERVFEMGPQGHVRPAHKVGRGDDDAVLGIVTPGAPAPMARSARWRHREFREQRGGELAHPGHYLERVPHPAMEARWHARIRPEESARATRQIRASDVGSENKTVSRQGRLGSGAVVYLAWWWIDHENVMPW